MMNDEVLVLLNELCSDFAPYGFLKYDRYKGKLLGGNNIYIKSNPNNELGMITGKRNYKKFGLDKFPTNFTTYTRFDGSDTEQGWTGDVLLEVLKHIKISINLDSK